MSNPNWRGEAAGRAHRATILDMYEEASDEGREPPLQRELAARLGVSDSAVRKHLQTLVAEGRLVKEGRIHRLP